VAAPLAIIEASARDCICEGGRRPANELLTTALVCMA
jgi:hypothetical protein